MIAPIIHKSLDRTRIVAEGARRVKQFLAVAGPQTRRDDFQAPRTC